MKPNFRQKIWVIFVSISLIISGFIFVEKNHKNNYQLLIKYKNSDQIKILSFKNKEQLEKAKNNLEKNTNITAVSKNNKYKIAYLPNDTQLNSQNYLKQINADLGWTFVHDAKDVVVAIIDTGIDLNHSDLKNNIWKNTKEIPDDNIDNDGNGYIDDIYGWDFVNNTNDGGVKISREYKRYAVNHGTVVAGIIGAVGDNSEGISGIAWNIKMMSLRAINSQGEGNTYDISRAINYAVKNGADIINLSFVGNENDPILADAIRRAAQAGVAIVAATGNETNTGINLDENPRYPACYDFNDNTVFGVGSVNKDNALSYFSNYGKNCIDIVAPGENFLSTEAYYPELFDFKEKYGSGFSGTSLSAPLVSGTIALIKSIDPNFTNQEIYKLLKDSAKNISFQNFSHRKEIGAGLLDVNNALIMARKLSNSRQMSIVTMPKIGNKYLIKIFDQKTNQNKEINLPLSKNFIQNNNTNVIKSGDINGDKKDEIIIASTNFYGTTISTYNQNFKLLSSFKIPIKNKVSMTISDLYKSGRKKIIIGASDNKNAMVYIYEYTGELLQKFTAYKNFKSGISITSCDMDNDFNEEIITVPNQGGGPHIIMFTKDGEVKGQFFAGNKDFRSGLNIACGDLNRDKKPEIVISPISNSMPYILIYNTNGELLSSFFAYDEKFRKEIEVNIADTNFDYQNEIIVNTTSGSAPHIRIFNIYGDLINQFFAYDKNNKNGVSLTTFSKKDAENN